MLKRHFIAIAAGGSLALGAGALAAQDAPPPLDKPEDVTIVLVRYLSTGDFFQAYLSGVENQSEALEVSDVGGGGSRRIGDRSTHAETQSFLNEKDIKNMDDLGAQMPQFQHADVAMADWMPLPAR